MGAASCSATLSSACGRPVYEKPVKAVADLGEVDDYNGLGLEEEMTLARLKKAAAKEARFDFASETKKKAAEQIELLKTVKELQEQRTKQHVIDEGLAYEKPMDRSVTTVLPEVAQLGPRVKVACTGRCSIEPEMAFQANMKGEEYNMKATALHGVPLEELLADKQGCCMHSIRGWGPLVSLPNQDDFFFAVTKDGYKLYGVLDGHGRDGHKVAAIARDALMRKLLEVLPAERDRNKKTHDANIKVCLEIAFEDAHMRIAAKNLAELDVAFSGACVGVVVYDKQNGSLHIAWSGNVKCVLGDFDVIEEQQNEHHHQRLRPGEVPKVKMKMKCKPLTQDHTTRVQTERDRIRNLGQADLRKAVMDDHVHEKSWEIFARGEIWPGIPITRCLGNLIAQSLGVLWKPEVVARPVGKAKFFVMATDGLWSVLSEEEVIKNTNDAKHHNIMYGVSLIVQRLQYKWTKKQDVGSAIDDATICTAWL